MPIFRDLAIFVPITTTTKPVTLPLAHAHGVIIILCDTIAIAANNVVLPVRDLPPLRGGADGTACTACCSASLLDRGGAMGFNSVPDSA